MRWGCCNGSKKICNSLILSNFFPHDCFWLNPSPPRKQQQPGLPLLKLPGNCSGWRLRCAPPQLPRCCFRGHSWWAPAGTSNFGQTWQICWSYPPFKKNIKQGDLCKHIGPITGCFLSGGWDNCRMLVFVEAIQELNWRIKDNQSNNMIKSWNWPSNTQTGCIFWGWYTNVLYHKSSDVPQLPTQNQWRHVRYMTHDCRHDV